MSWHYVCVVIFNCNNCFDLSGSYVLGNCLVDFPSSIYVVDNEERYSRT